jgi:hypothetical protein
VAFEPLGTRIALSAGGIAPFMIEMDTAPRMFEAPAEHSRGMDVGGEFTTLQQNAWQRTGGAASVSDASSNFISYSTDGLRNSEGPGWRQQEILVGTSEFERPMMGGNGGFANHRDAETRVAPASVQIAGTSLVLPGLLVSRGDALTLVISTAPIYGLPVGPQSYFQIDGRAPQSGERNGAPKAPVELAMQQAASSNDDHPSDRSLGLTSGNPGPSGTFSPPPRMSDATLALSTIEPRTADARTSGGWVAGVRTEVERKIESVPNQTPVTGQWAISKTELEEGLIELESPLVPRRKGRKLPGDALEGAEEQHDGWAELQAFAERVWSAWNQAWRDLGRNGDQSTEAIGEAARIAPGKVAGFDADVIDGLVELTVGGAMSNAVLPQQPREQLAESNLPVRIDAGVAIHQEFEVATAAEAAPPATARKAERQAGDDERAEAEKPVEGQPLSAAAVGAGMLIGLPFSLRRRRPDEDERQLPRLRRT